MLGYLVVVVIVGFCTVYGAGVALSLPVKCLVRIEVCLLPPQGRTGVSTQRSKLKQLSAPLLQAPPLLVEVAGPLLGFSPGSGESPASAPSGFHRAQDTPPLPSREGGARLRGGRRVGFRWRLAAIR